jgi:hypothetical protein
MADNIFQISYGATTVDAVYKTFVDQNIARDDAKIMAAQWLLENVYSAGRSFAYSRPFPATDAACSPGPFARGFAHADWIDGESTVQAGKTATDDGFNERFHKIEGDLDRLGTLAAESFTCMNAMRENLARALEDIRAELNRVNADLAKLKNGTTTVVPGVFGPIQKVPKFLGKTKLLDQVAQMWQLDTGQIVSLPEMVQAATPTMVNPATRAPGIAEILADEGEILRTFPDKVRVGDLVEKFGDRIAGDGRPLGDLLSALPANQEFENLAAVLGKVSELDAALIKGLGGEARVRAQIGQEAGSLAGTELGKVQEVSPALVQALEAEGVRTVGDLAGLNTTRLASIAAGKGVALSSREANVLVAKAMTLRNF